MNWHWLYEILEGEMAAEDIVLANPYKTRIIAEAQVKTDKVDAFILAQLLRGNPQDKQTIVNPRAGLESAISAHLFSQSRSGTEHRPSLQFEGQAARARAFSKRASVRSFPRTPNIS